MNYLNNTVLAQERGSFWLPPQASTTAADVDWVFQFIFGVSAFFFILIVTLMIIFIIRFKRREGVEPGAAPHHSMALELTWSIIPTIIVVLIFAFGFTTYMNMRIAPDNAYEINVTGQKWKWLFTYPNGHVDENLHVPVDIPVRLILTSVDVIHSLFVPAFRIKMDAVPGRYTDTWFQAKDPGEYLLFCAEYCGTSHSDMTSMVVVHKVGEFEKWMQDAANFLNTMPPAEAGTRLYKIRGCAQCHSIDGTGGHGPTFKNLFGRDVALKNGSTVAADENYIRTSILDPMADIVAGFEPVMPTYQGKLKAEEVTAIIEYIKTLREE
ncbi:MAG: cytochrome c oxidase subunit II [Candidatus Omnitrophota bacterium]|jgi:cytochrome c oxidase subunit 2|nr:MAG: cytochrome c oxidase subunit II [Candidatus Omnitrophota bacterium]